MNYTKYAIIIIALKLQLFSVEFTECKHLLNRTNFGIVGSELKNCTNKSTYKEAVEDIINKNRFYEKTTPSFAENIIRAEKQPKESTLEQKIEARKVFTKELRTKQEELKSWWLNKMISTNDPFLEKMVFFWHNHFTSSIQKVKQPTLMYNQNELFRKHALGNFRELLHAIVEDPAMLIYLDNRANKKKHPNENLARELLELFTLGEGNYKEQDIKELARALTGYSLNKDLEFKFIKNMHDYGQKVFFGKKGKFDIHNMLDIILEQNKTSEFIVKKLWLEFVSYSPNDDEIKRLAAIFRENNYEIKPLMIAIFTSNYFTDKSNYAQMIKSPADIVVGSLRSLELGNFDTKIALKYFNRLGQSLLNPPNVKGWPGQKSWIDANTLLVRKEFLQELTRGDDINHMQLKADDFSKNLLPLDVYFILSKNKKEDLQTVLQHPTYQLK